MRMSFMFLSVSEDRTVDAGSQKFGVAPLSGVTPFLFWLCVWWCCSLRFDELWLFVGAVVRGVVLLRVTVRAWYTHGIR